LNTQWADSYNFYMLLQEKQQDAQFDWLRQTLLDAEANNEKVIFLGHISCGDAADGTLTDYAVQYIDIVNKYQHIIVGQFFGHTHNDEFQLVNDNNGSPMSVIYIAPSVTTFTNHNPSFRIYEYTNDYQLIDYHQFIANLTWMNQNNKSNWFLEYSAVKEYQLKNVTASGWSDLIKRFESNDALFQKWYSNKYTQRSFNCDAACKKDCLCDMISADPDNVCELNL